MGARKGKKGNVPKPRGPKPESLALPGNWEDAVKKAVEKPTTAPTRTTKKQP